MNEWRQLDWKKRKGTTEIYTVWDGKTFTIKHYGMKAESYSVAGEFVWYLDLDGRQKCCGTKDQCKWYAADLAVGRREPSKDEPRWYFYDKKNKTFRVTPATGEKALHGRKSKQFPKEDDYYCYLRVHLNIPDDKPVSGVMEDAKFEYKKPDEKKEEEPAEKYTGPAPDERDLTGLRIIRVPGGACKIKPANAKFATLYEWAEKLRDYHQIRGEFLMLPALQTFARGSFKKFDRGTKAAARLALVYAAEARKEKTDTAAAIERANRPEPVKVIREKRGNDEYGYRIGSKAAKINAVLTREPQTKLQIARLADVTGVANHLGSLVRKGVLRRTKKGRFYLPDENKPKKKKKRRPSSRPR